MLASRAPRANARPGHLRQGDLASFSRSFACGRLVRCGLGEGPRARRRRSGAVAERMCCSGANPLVVRRACSCGVAYIRGRRGAHVASISRAARCWAACFCYFIAVRPEKRPWAARSGDHGSRLRLAGPTTHQGSIWAPVIIRFPRRRRPMSCSWQTFTLSFGIHHMMVAGLQQCLRYRKRGLNTVISLLAPRRLTSAFA